MRRGSALRDWAAGLSPLRRAACAVFLALASTTVFVEAAEADRPQLESEVSAAQCLVVEGDAAIAYPSEAVKAGRGGIVRVRLTFRSPDRAPVAEVFYDSTGDPFRELVLERVARYRLPCLRPETGVLVATQEFVFSPVDERSVRWAPMRGESSEQANVFGCLVGDGQQPQYPDSAYSDRVTRGTVVARMRFVAPDRPPEVTILSNGGSNRFARVVERTVEAYRLPCMNPSSPLVASQEFVFAMNGGPASFLKDSTIAGFVASLDEASRGRVRFDFNTMGCPFQVRFVLRQPFLPNRVGEVATSDPNRREFIEWLRQAEFRLRDETHRTMLTGSSMTITVPCTVLDLT